MNFGESVSFESTKAQSVPGLGLRRRKVLSLDVVIRTHTSTEACSSAAQQ